jgi:hypothetical protein
MAPHDALLFILGSALQREVAPFVPFLQVHS